MTKFKFTKNIFFCFSMISLFYFLFLGTPGIAYTNDSMGYIEIGFAREPLYPLLICLFKNIFGINSYLNVLIIFQGLFACFAVMKLFFLISTHFYFSFFENTVSYLLLILPFGIDTLWKSPRFVYTHFIATEGITYSLYYLFLTYLLSFIFHKQFKYFAISSLLSLLCILTRSQLMICIPVLLLAAIYVYFKNMKTLLLSLCICISLFIGNSLIVNIYHHHFNGIFASPMENKLTLFSNFLYASDAQDSELIINPKHKKFYNTVFEQSYNLEYNYTFADNTIGARIDKFIDSHDKIKYDILRGELNNYVQKYYPKHFQTYEGEQIKKELLTSLLSILEKDNFTHWLYTCLSLIPESLMLSFNPVTPPSILVLCYVYSLILSGFIILSLIYTIIKQKSLSDYTLFLVAIFSLLATNAVGLSFSIYGISRYTNYNLGLIYITLYIFIKEILQKRRVP